LLDIDKTSKDNKAEGKNPIIDFPFDLQTSSQRCLACTLYLLEENENNGHTKMDIIELKHQVERLVPACSNFYGEIIKDDSIYFNKDKKEISLKSTYEIEKYIADNILSGLKTNIKWDYDYKQYQNSGEYPLTDDQINALKLLCNHNISILNGSAGTGKSQTTASIIKMLEDNNKSYKLFSPTGKAAKILAEYTHRNASTIHRGLGYIPPSEWTYNEENKLGCDVLIIDEFSMVDIFLFKHVINSINPNKTKILFVFDSYQLASVGCGNIAQDLLSSKEVPTVILTKIFRYAEGGLMQVVTNIRNGIKFLENTFTGTKIFGTKKDFIFCQLSDSKIQKQVLGIYKKLLKE
jgi:exodeoxyribonuclease V alpha subunit